MSDLEAGESDSGAGGAGRLFVVATPIGNLADVTRRAAETLASVGRVVAEDTRRARKLLTHLGVRGVTVSSLDANADARKIDAIVRALETGTDVAVVTDAGTPSVSDPGRALVQAAVDRGIPVLAIPGPSALTAAIAVSALVDGSFLFLGFLPRGGTKRRRALERVASTEEAVILFEAPGRVAATLRDLARAEPERHVAVCRELTKRFEQTVRGTLGEVARHGEWRGEVTIVLGPGTGAASSDAVSEDEIDRRLRWALRDGLRVKDAAAAIAESTGRSKRELYARAQRLADVDD